MVYKEALIKVHSFESLKGKSIDNGFTIKDVVIVPADKDKRKSFINNCILNDQNVNGYFEEGTDVFIWAIDTDYLKSANILFFQDLTNK